MNAAHTLKCTSRYEFSISSFNGLTAGINEVAEFFTIVMCHIFGTNNALNTYAKQIILFGLD
jgi:hypothetical protein